MELRIREVKLKLSLNQKVFIGSLFGIIVGYILSQTPESPITPSLIGILTMISTLFINMLKMVIIPLIFSSLTVGITNLQEHRHSHRVWQLTIAYYLLSLCLAAMLGLIAVNIFEPGKGGIPLEFGVESTFNADKLSSNGFFEQFLSGLFKNPIAAMAEGQILPTIIFAIFFGVSIVALGEKAKMVSQFMEEMFALMMKIISWIIKLLPIGIFCLLAKLLSTQDSTLFASIGYFMIVVIGATLVHGFIILPLLLWVLGRMSPMTFFKGMSEAMITAFSTSSSTATIPVTFRCLTDNLNVNKSIVGFVIPLGATVNLDGTALYEAIAAIFVANLWGIDLNFGQQCIVFVMAIVASIGAPGIPSAGMVTMILVLQSVGLPAEAIAILIPIDRALDTVRTMVNVEGDAVGSVIVQNLLNKVT